MFEAEVLAAGRGGHAVVVPAGVAAAFAGKRPAVLAHVDGTAYRSRLMVYGGRSYLGLRQDLLRALGKRAGDRVSIELTPDVEQPPEPPEPEAPDLLAALAGDSTAHARWEALPPEHRREYLRWVAAAGEPGDRAQRVARTMRRLAAAD